MLASYHHCETVVQRLISAGCDVNARTPPEYDSRNALNLYSDDQLSYEDDKIIDLLHAAGADLEQGSTSGKKPLHFAARENNVRATRRLLELGARLDSRRGYGETPLHTAALYGSVEAGRLLLEMGANRMAEHWEGGLNSRWKGLTPLAFAGSRLQKGFIELLIEEYGVAPLARPRTRDTIVHFAISNTGEDMLKMLLDIPKLKRQDVLNQKNDKGIAPLHTACGNGRQPHVELLVKAGADINQLTDSGHSPFDLAYHARASMREAIVQGG
jgi:ankyrin repeat protein